MSKVLYNSRDKIQNSMVRLMKSVPYNDITVTMITGDAGINRKTFYAYYSNKDELLVAMLYEMFNDLFSCFMYKKDASDVIPVDTRLLRDVRSFLEKVIYYEERLLVLITNETSEFSISIADQVVLSHYKDISFLRDINGTIPGRFYLEIIRNFFMSIIGAWIDSEEKSFDESVDALVTLMKHSYLDMFCYVK